LSKIILENSNDEHTLEQKITSYIKEKDHCLNKYLKQSKLSMKGRLHTNVNNKIELHIY